MSLSDLLHDAFSSKLLFSLSLGGGAGPLEKAVKL